MTECRTALLVLTVAAILLAGACGSSSTDVTGPSGAKCQVSATPSAPSFPPSGGSASLAITAARECGWSVSTDASWLTFPSASGQGNATVQFSVAANPAPSARTATVTVNDQQLSITEQAATCRFDLSPLNPSFAAAGGSGSIAVTAQAGCAWTAASGAPWITLSGAISGNGSGVVQFSVAANAGAARSGTLTIAGQTVTVSQDGSGSPPPTCSYTVVPTSQNFPAAGGSGSLAVTTTASCAWSATSNVTWVTITSGATGTSSGLATFTVDPNTGVARSGTVTIAGQTVTVTQDAASGPPTCSFTISPTSQSLPAAGGSGSAAVTTTPGCAWSAISNVTWVTVTSGAAGTGSGLVTFTVDANTGVARSGTLTIAGQTFTVSEGTSLVTVSGQVLNLQGQCPTVTFTVGATSVATDANTLYTRTGCGNLRDRRSVTVVGQPNPNGSLLAVQITIG